MIYTDHFHLGSVQEVVTGSVFFQENFRPEYLVQLEHLMKEKLPGRDIPVQSNIESKVRTLKKQYQAIAEMMGPGCSGFGQNDEFNYIEVEKEMFDLWVKVKTCDRIDFSYFIAF